ncbi:hypothetical protein [Tsukamurella sp. NPDC003166]|uniref:hypothetical protein n=1 Tax=Tsukamurella sp. NPDC003166 TaxID=3154444 RepID=UPI0033A804D8
MGRGSDIGVMADGVQVLRTARSLGFSRRAVLKLAVASASSALVAACTGEDVAVAPLKRFAAGQWNVEVKNSNSITTFRVHVKEDGTFVSDGYDEVPSNPYRGQPFPSGKWEWSGSRVRIYQVRGESGEFESIDVPVAGDSGEFDWIMSSVLSDSDPSKASSPNASMSIAVTWSEATSTLVLRRKDDSGITITARRQ